MSNEMPFSESEYWEVEIPNEEIDEQANQGEALLLAPHFLPHRIQRMVWNNRIKLRYRHPYHNE